MLRAARSEDAASSPTASSWSRTSRPSDGGKAIVAGNERVIRARLSDAKFFYETDLKTQARRPAAEVRADRVPREARHPGASASSASSGWPRSWRRSSAPMSTKAKRAARLCQGRPAHRSGRRIPRTAGPDGPILRAGARRGRGRRARASRSTTSRSGPADRVPTDPVSIAVALADKIDMLVGFWAIDEKPTGIARIPMRCGARRWA